MGSYFSTLFQDKNRNWFYIFGAIFFLLLITYAVTHHKWKGEENVNLTKLELGNINAIVNSIKSDSSINKSSKATLDTITVNSVEDYIRSRYSVVDSVKRRNGLHDFLKQYAVAGFSESFLIDYKLRVRSYFWLTENLVFLEIIFWSLFGVLCSLFYTISEAVVKGEYKVDLKYIHAAKLFYAPLTALVIYFSLNALVSNGEANLNSLRHGLIILSFVLGFFSGRTMELLNRIKDLFFPAKSEGGPASAATTYAPTTEESEIVTDEATEAARSSVG